MPLQNLLNRFQKKHFAKIHLKKNKEFLTSFISVNFV